MTESTPNDDPQRPKRRGGNNAKNLGPPWKKGQSGNPKGRPKKLPRIDELLANVLGEADTQGMTEAEKILRALRVKAKKGSITAAEALLDRAYGKPKQAHEVTGADGAPLVPPRIEVVLVAATASDANAPATRHGAES